MRDRYLTIKALEMWRILENATNKYISRVEHRIKFGHAQVMYLAISLLHL